MPNNSPINERSHELNAALERIPNWIIRWGITVIIATFLGLLILAGFIKYPETINGKVIITTQHPPISIIALNSGEMQDLRLNEGMSVEQGDVIATLGNSFSEDAKNYLDTVCKLIRQNLLKKNEELVLNSPDLTFGTLQPAYTELITSLNNFQDLQFHNKVISDIESLKNQIQNHAMLRSISYQQLNSAQKEYEIVSRKLKSDRTLLEKEVISKVQFFEVERDLIRVESMVGNYKKEAVNASIQLEKLKKQLNDLEFDHSNAQKIALQNLLLQVENVENLIQQWGQNFQFISPIKGNLSYYDAWHKHQFIEAGTKVFAVIPDDEQYVGYMDIDGSGSGKVEVGQIVRIRLDKFPFQEYGELEGKIIAVSTLPKDNMYRIQFKLAKGMKSTYGKELKFSPELSGTAQIITEDVRLISRVFNSFKSLFD